MPAVARIAAWLAALLAGIAIAAAQDVPQPGEVPAPTASPYLVQHGGVAPVRCYQLATDARVVSDSQARLLCTGALSTGPAECFAAAGDRVNLSESQAVELCRRAESDAPVVCVEQLEDELTIGDPQLTAYCSGVRWPLIVPPGGGDPACLTAAFQQTNLSDSMALQLCRGSVGIDPVACYVAGDAETTLSDDALVGLCTTVVEAYPLTGTGLW